MDDKDYKKYAYFTSKASNYSVIFKPQVEEILADGSRRIAKGDDGKEMVGLRIEFRNGMLRYEKTEENMPMIKFLRTKCENENKEPANRQQLKEITKPIKMVKEEEMKTKLAEKDEEIKKLKEQTEPEENRKTTGEKENVSIENF